MTYFIIHLGYFIKDFHIAFTARVQFFRLLPKNARHCDAKRPVKVVPVKLSWPQNNLWKKHVDCHFAMAFVKHARELASLFWDENVFFFSMDDKARVLLGLLVWKKETAILMQLGKIISWSHLFILHLNKNKDGAIGYNRPAYIVAIQSGKHNIISAASNIEDFQAFVSLDKFKEVCLKDRILIPLLFVSVDGGLAKAPKSTMTIETWVAIFK